MADGVSHGDAKGPGNGSPIKQFTPENAAAIGQRGGWMRAKMAEWRKNNPDAPPTHSERARILREIIRDGTPEALDAVRDIIDDPLHKDSLSAAKTWIEQDLGRPTQAVEMNATIKRDISAFTDEELAAIAGQGSREE